MTPTEQNVNEAIDWLQKTGGQLQDFTVEQAPLYCRELIQYELWFGGIWVGVAVVLLIVTILCIWHWIREKDEDIGGTGLGLALIAAFILIVTGADFVKAIVAPRVVVVEHLKGLVK